MVRRSVAQPRPCCWLFAGTHGGAARHLSCLRPRPCPVAHSAHTAGDAHSRIDTPEGHDLRPPRSPCAPLFRDLAANLSDSGAAAHSSTLGIVPVAQEAYLPDCHGATRLRIVPRQHARTMFRNLPFLATQSCAHSSKC